MIKLAKMPDRTPVKIVISVSPALYQALIDYADLYAKVYDTAETVAELIPAMLASFLESDRDFAKSRKAGSPANSRSLGAGLG